VGVIEKAREKLNPWNLSWAMTVLLFALIVTWQNRGLTFFWDEWDVVWATVESPNFGLLQDNGGNFFPLSRGVFALEMYLFGAWYPGYVFITSLIFGNAAFVFNLVLDNGTVLRRITLSAFTLIYLSSTGVLFASSMGFMLKWGLSPLLAIISAAFFIKSIQGESRKKRNLIFAWVFFFLSWASFSSSIALMALLIIGLIHSRVGWRKSTSFEIRLSTIIFAASIVAIFVGFRLATINPPLNPLIGDAQDSMATALAADPISVTRLALASTLSGLLSVITALPLQDNGINSWLIIAFNDYLAVLVALITAALGLIYAFKKALPNKQVVLLFVLLFGANLFISIARSPLIHRYQALWVFLAILVVLALMNWFNSLKLRSLTLVITTLLVLAAALSVWHIGTGALSIANIERQRDLADSNRLGNPALCLNEAERTLDQIAPTIAAKQICELLEILEARDWVLNRQFIER